MKPLAFDPGAISDLQEAASYYEAQTEGAGEWFEVDVDRAFQKLQANPQHSPKVGRTAFRKYLTRRFHYIIYFLERPAYIWVAAVAHPSRRPGYWRGRTPPG